MADLNGVVGSDNVVPIYEPEGRWVMWSVSEIYTGGPGRNKYVPKENDYVIDPQTYTTWIVDHTDPITLIPTLREIRPANMSYTFTETDVLFGVSPISSSDTYRVYLDTSVLPYVLAVDSRLKIGGSLSHYCKLFKGLDLGVSGKVISRIYDNSGNFISENVPLELLAIDSHINYSIKGVSVCNTIENMVNGDIVTAVFYNDQGHVVSKRQLMVERTGFIRSIEASKKYISHIGLDCPFLSPTDDKVIAFPLNIPTNALNLVGIVYYSDGSSLRLPVDNTKFTMYGLDQYVSTIIGQQISLVLKYRLANNEIGISNNVNNDYFITENYNLVTVNPNNSYTVKLFVYPVWVSEEVGYTLRWWLLNLDRNIYFDVTNHVDFSSITGPFNPTAYNSIQRKNVSINLRDVSGSFRSFIHVQTVEIVLNGFPSNENTPWTVSHEFITGRPRYGESLYVARRPPLSINLSSGETVFNDWLTKVYKGTYPLVNNFVSNVIPTPTHFIVSYGNIHEEFPITDWDNDLNMGVNIPLYKSIIIRFIKRTVNLDMQLSIAEMIVK
jgi:hypothetical protein